MYIKHLSAKTLALQKADNRLKKNHTSLKTLNIKIVRELDSRLKRFESSLRSLQVK
jgi:hypothetical protein